MVEQTEDQQIVLEPLPFHRQMEQCLRKEYAGLWDWFTSSQVLEDQTEQARLNLLKSCYRIDRETQGVLYAPLEQAAAVLGIDVPLTLYQAEGSHTGASACIYAIPDEVHIVLFGAITELLTQEEQTALYGHELAHFLLLNREGGCFRTVSEMLNAMCNDPQAGNCHHNSLRLFQLYSEVFADRGGLAACGSLETAVSMEVKLATGLKEVSASGYLEQAEEIFAKERVVTDGVSHPESFIRARSLRLWSEQGYEAEVEIRRMISGDLSLKGLDLITQSDVQNLTRKLLDLALSPGWIRSDLVMAHARLFFEDFTPSLPGENTEAEIRSILDRAADDLKAYTGYVLLDLAAADPDLEEVPLAHCALLAGTLGLAAPFRDQAAKELRMTKKRYDQLLSEAKSIVEKAARGTEA